MKEFFVVSRLHREDLKQIGVKADFSDDEMQAIADKMGENFCDCCYWQSLETLVNRIMEEREI